jgi:patatin-like phospholipase/acyl hydrolase
MSDPNTIRVLSLDGGGDRGYLSLVFLERLLQLWGINQNEIWKYFDVIAGTSIGGIQALGYAFGKSPNDLRPFFLEKGKRIFTIRRTPVGNNTSSNSNKPNTLQKVALLIEKDPFYKSSAPLPDGINTYNWSNPSEDDIVFGGDWNDYSNYGSNVLHDVLCKNFNDNTLQNLKTNVLIPAYREDLAQYVMFSNVNSSFYHAPDSRLFEVARATSAAPIYLPTYSFNNGVYSDGGVFMNNPTEVALSLAMELKPTARRFCVLSLGTGLGTSGFQEVVDGVKQPTTDGIAKVMALFDIASTGAQESVDLALLIKSKRSIEQLNYYRFQPKLDQNIDTELDSSSSGFFDYLSLTANSIFNTDIGNISNFIGKLKA